MNILDCENENKAYSSIQNITGLNKEEVNDIFKELDFDRFYSNHPEVSEPNEVFPHLLEKDFNINYKVDYVVWFHATRTHEIELFNRGILHLSKVMEEIWQFLYGLIKNEVKHDQWNQFKKQFETNKLSHHNAYLYNLKMKNPSHWGPHGFLIKELIFKPDELGNWDYLGAPEIVYDICKAFDDHYKLNLLEKYFHSSKSVIIKFRDRFFMPAYIGYAFLYLYGKYMNEEIGRSCNCCFAAKGIEIKSNDILKVEVIKNWQTNLLNDV